MELFQASKQVSELDSRNMLRTDIWGGHDCIKLYTVANYEIQCNTYLYFLRDFAASV
jgi:hypothetical protein